MMIPRAILPAGLTAFVALAMAATAWGAPAITAKAKDISSAGPGNQTVSCPDGQFASGGGGVTDRGRIKRTFPKLNANDKPVGWIVNESQASYVEAICVHRAALDGLRVRTKRGSAEFIVRCGPDRIATGGGASVDDPSGNWISRTEPVSNSSNVPVGWKVNITGPGTAYVICVRKPALDLTVRSAFDTGSAAVLCSDGEVPVGGGAGVGNPPDGLAITGPAFVNHDPRGWYGGFLHDGADTSGSVYGICAA